MRGSPLGGRTAGPPSRPAVCRWPGGRHHRGAVLAAQTTHTRTHTYTHIYCRPPYSQIVMASMLDLALSGVLWVWAIILCFSSHFDSGVVVFLVTAVAGVAGLYSVTSQYEHKASTVVRVSGSGRSGRRRARARSSAVHSDPRLFVPSPAGACPGARARPGQMVMFAHGLATLYFMIGALLGNSGHHVKLLGPAGFRLYCVAMAVYWLSSGVFFGATLQKWRKKRRKPRASDSELGLVDKLLPATAMERKEVA